MAVPSPPTQNIRIAFDRLPRSTHEEQVFNALRKLVENNGFLRYLNGMINDVHSICDQDFEVVYKRDQPQLREISIRDRRTVDLSNRAAVIRSRYTPPS